MEAWTPNLSWIQRDLAVGGSYPTEAAARLARDHGVRAVIDLREEACDDRDALAALGMAFLHLPTPDLLGVAQPMLEDAVRFARQARGEKLLVHCEHGIGRSALVALCVLVDRGLEPLSALSLAKTRRALISPSREQYEAWATWVRGRGGAAPSYHEFGVIAYRPSAAAS